MKEMFARGPGRRGFGHDERFMSEMGGRAELLGAFFGRGPRAKRGDIRAGVLALLSEHPYNGYQIMQELEQRSKGVWRPSPGSVYPTLQQLEEEGLVHPEESGTGRVYTLTEQGVRYAKEHCAELKAPWEEVRRSMGSDKGHAQFHELLGQMRQIGSAAIQVAREGDAAQLAQAQRILDEARRGLYRILADGDDANGE